MLRSWTCKSDHYQVLPSEQWVSKKFGSEGGDLKACIEELRRSMVEYGWIEAHMTLEGVLGSSVDVDCPDMRRFEIVHN